MYSHDWRNYIYELQQIITRQQEQIKNLEERVTTMEEQIQENKSPSIDKIEYHFDQLKIERLDGTLHIGLTPNELANIDDLGLPNLKTPQQPKTSNPINQQLIPRLNMFVNTEVPKMIHELSQNYQRPIDRKLEGDMVHDILGQIPERIVFYEKEALEKHQITNPEQLESYIDDHIKKEIYQSVRRFMEKTDVQRGDSE